MTAKPPIVPFVRPTQPSFVDRPLGAPLDEYDGQKDMTDSIALGFEVIRDRIAKGGPGWEPSGASAIGQNGKGATHGSPHPENGTSDASAVRGPDKPGY